MLEWPRPILVAAKGQCLGGALEFAAAGHLMLVAPDAQLGQPEMTLAVFAPAASVLMPLRVRQACAVAPVPFLLSVTSDLLPSEKPATAPI
jgi:cyclohexa-1,5-dienecarbonyl-CoA hydratase